MYIKVPAQFKSSNDGKLIDFRDINFDGFRLDNSMLGHSIDLVTNQSDFPLYLSKVESILNISNFG